MMTVPKPKLDRLAYDVIKMSRAYVPNYIMHTQIWRTTSKLEHEIGPYNNTIRKILY